MSGSSEKTGVRPGANLSNNEPHVDGALCAGFFSEVNKMAVCEFSLLKNARNGVTKII